MHGANSSMDIQQLQLKWRTIRDHLSELKHGRVLVIEYMGADPWSTDDSKEKRAILIPHLIP